MAVRSLRIDRHEHDQEQEERPHDGPERSHRSVLYSDAPRGSHRLACGHRDAVALWCRDVAFVLGELRLTTRGVRLIVKEFLSELHIEKSTHGFRHYFTSTLIRAYKGDLLEVARYTRHRSLEMLQVYNDNINRQADLPRYYQTFEGVGF